MITNILHKHFCRSNDALASWYNKKLNGLGYPIYSSYDIRDAGFKISNVDANIYPAGFNNICQVDNETSVDLMAEYIRCHYGANIKKVMILAEAHTNNPYYWDNVAAIRGLLEQSGVKVLVSIPRKLEQPLQLTSARGVQVEVASGFGETKEVQDFKPDLIISNNDFSEELADWGASIQSNLNVPINPPRELGWYQRKKSRYFHYYNQLVNEFSNLTQLDPFLLNVKTEVFSDFKIEDENSAKLLASAVDKMIAELKEDYKKRNIADEPFVFVKNNAGTYGLAVIRVGSGKEVEDWNYKSRKKMKAAKGGRDVEEVIIQEGIPSRVKSEGTTAEPVIYMIGKDLAGGFLRTHAEKNETESLNSPGAVYKRLCVSDLNVTIESHPLENVYGWSARLGLLAIALEAQEMNAKFDGFKDCAKQTV
jgi:glutamate--cysteine ligase